MVEPNWCMCMQKAIKDGFIHYFTDNIDEKGETDIVELVYIEPVPDSLDDGKHDPIIKRLTIRYCPFCGNKITMFVAPPEKCKDISAERKALKDEYWDSVAQEGPEPILPDDDDIVTSGNQLDSYGSLE